MIRLPRISPPLIALTAATLLAVGALAGALLTPTTTPKGISATATVTTATATELKTADVQDATLAVTASAARKLTTSASGTVTATTCTPGGTATSGTTGLAINNDDLIYLATSQPMWRDLTIGDSGGDVRALQSELARVGYPTRADGRFGTVTLSALIKLAKHLDIPGAAGWTGFPAARFVWMPAPSIQTVTCDLQVGSAVTAGGSLATLPHGISGARLAPVPTGVMPGPRQVLAGDLKLSVDAGGVITASTDLDKLAQSDAYRAFAAGAAASPGNPSSGGVLGGSDGAGSASGGGMPVRFELAAPVTVYSVPAAAVYGTSGANACVLAADKPVAVTIAGSQLGQTFVIPAAGTTLSSVGLQTAKAPPCR